MRNSRNLVLQACTRTASLTLSWAVFAVLAVLLIGTAQAQTFSVIHVFTNQGGDGGSPTSGPILDAKGNIYGTTNTGGNLGVGGALYQITPTGHYTTLSSFGNSIIGESGPQASPLRDAKGNFFGTTDYNLGTVYEVSKGDVLTTLWEFSGGNDGAMVSYAGLVLDKTTLYGITYGNYFVLPCSGPPLCGTIYKLQTKTHKLTTLHDFGKGADGADPSMGLTEDADGNFYGTTICGGTYDEGNIFEFTKTGKYKNLYSFHTKQGRCVDGSPGGPLGSGAMVWDGKGDLFGATATDSKSGFGMVFRFNTSARKLTDLHDFSGGADGAIPIGGLVQDAKGNFYGVAQGGGNSGGYGTVFEVDTTGKFTVLYTFTGGTDGADPVGLTIAADGTLYGATFQGGDFNCFRSSSGCGVVFKVTF